MLTCKRDLVHLPEGLHYLNCAYMGPLLKSVEEAGIEAIRRRRDPASITPDDFFSGADRARNLFGQLVHCPPERVSILPAVSYATAIVAKNLRLAENQNVVVARGQFPSNVYAWKSLAAASGAELRTVDPPDTARGRGQGWNERILAAIDAGTALVALGNVHWADGTRFDLEAIGERVREVGALLVVDGTQSVGAMPFDVRAVQPDVLVCAGYKWLLGPYSLGLAYWGPRVEHWSPLEETWLGRRDSQDFTRLVDYVDDYQPGAARMDMGQRSNFTLMPMMIAALEQIVSWGPANVQDYCRALTADLIDEASALGCTIEDEPWRGAHLFGIRTPPDLDAGKLQAALAERRVSVSLRGDAVRVAPNVYNSLDDVTALTQALRAARS